MKMKQKGIATAAIAVVVIIIIALVGVGAYLLLKEKEEEVGLIAGATSLSCKVDATYQEQTMTFDIKAKNLQDAANFMLRMEGTVVGQSVIYIINAAQNKGWTCTADEWQEVPIEQLSPYQTRFATAISQLSGWTAGDFTYTDPITGASVRIYDIVVNPELEDSLFQH